VILPDDFRLVAACCIWPPSERRNAAIRAAAGGNIDWKNVLRVVARQRVSGLAHDGLERAGIEVPAKVKARIAADASDIARQSLMLAQEALKLQAAFDAAGLPAAFVKGSALALLAYGKLGIKHAWDIDLLVEPKDLSRVGTVLAEAGFERQMPPASMSEERFRAWTDFAREGLYRQYVRGTFLELHWRLSDNRSLLAHVTASTGTRKVEIAPGQFLRTLEDADLFAYLCLHGAHHGWSRMKWLADLAALLAQKPLAEVETLYRKAKADGVGRAAAQALLLCERLFGLPLPDGLAAEMQRDRAIRWLVSVALNAMAGDAASRQTEDRPLGNFEIEISHFLLATGMRAWLRELESKAIGWTDFQNFALPRPLYFLYPLLRLPSWAWRRVAHKLGGARQSPG
jgi:hypothetical protein